MYYLTLFVLLIAIHLKNKGFYTLTYERIKQLPTKVVKLYILFIINDFKTVNVTAGVIYF